jgi:hypothetical protein
MYCRRLWCLLGDHPGISSMTRGWWLRWWDLFPWVRRGDYSFLERRRGHGLVFRRGREWRCLRIRAFDPICKGGQLVPRLCISMFRGCCTFFGAGGFLFFWSWFRGGHGDVFWGSTWKNFRLLSGIQPQSISLMFYAICNSIINAYQVDKVMIQLSCCNLPSLEHKISRRFLLFDKRPNRSWERTSHIFTWLS